MIQLKNLFCNKFEKILYNIYLIYNKNSAVNLITTEFFKNNLYTSFLNCKDIFTNDKE